MPNMFRRRRLISFISSIVILFAILTLNGVFSAPTRITNQPQRSTTTGAIAIDALGSLSVKGRAPKTNYSRQQFGDGWAMTGGCDTRNIILHRDLTATVLDKSCNVTAGVLDDPYTGKTIQFQRGTSTSSNVQIDHVAALSDTWQKGAQQLSKEQRIALANDPLELLAVDGPANQQKSDGDAATWLPSYKPFRCQYVARQIAVKQKYNLWVTQAEKDAMTNVLKACPEQRLPANS
jgi:hypothetical protein